VNDDDLPSRLEMLLVLRWLQREGAPDDPITISVSEVAGELDLPDDRDGLMRVMRAMGRLEERGAISVAWPRGGRGDVQITLAPEVRADARRLFGRG
jgi:hypothetical protein